MTVYIVDTECTGTEPDREVVELAYMRISPEKDLVGLSNRIPTERPMFLAADLEYEQYFQPEKPSTTGALATHHILPSDLEGRPPSKDAAMPDDLLYMIGHNIDFDWEALRKPYCRRICTYGMAQHVWPDTDSYNLSALLYLTRGATEQTRGLLKDAHSALTDVQNTTLLLEDILDKNPEIVTWEQLWEFSEQCRIPLRMPITNARGELISDIEPGLLTWCLRQDWIPIEHPYLHQALLKERERRNASWG